MEYTKNYHLPQWAEEDRIQMEDFNDAMASIESGLDSKADEITVTALEEAVSANLGEITANLGAAGKNCRITWGSYTGNGNYGSSKKTTITTPGFYPVLVCVGSPSDVSYTSWPWLMMRPCTVAQAMTGYNINVSWTDTSVSWYGDRDANQQMNQSGKTYYYVVLGYDKDAETTAK